jgi:[acyl-carrier-protein] S-malonyltransferase
MFSVIFPGQGSQMVGMGKEFYDNFDLVKNLFKEADDTLSFSISKLILEGPKEELDLTANTQPAIFLISYAIYSVVKKEFNIDLSKAKYFAGHSLGEYSALSCAGLLKFFRNSKNFKDKRRCYAKFSSKGRGWHGCSIRLNC